MKIQHALSTAALLALTTVAGADTISARFDGVSPRQDVSFSLDGGINFTSTQAGYFNWTRTGGTYAGPGAWGQFITFCIDVSQHIQGGNTYDYDVLDPADAPLPGAGMGATRADRLAELFGRFFDTEFDAMHAAAFQSAVWEIVYDDGLQLAAGDFRIDGQSDMMHASQDMLDSIDGSGPRFDLLAIASQNVQDQVFYVPTPATGLLMALGAIAAGSRRRRSV